MVCVLLCCVGWGGSVSCRLGGFLIGLKWKLFGFVMWWCGLCLMSVVLLFEVDVIDWW